jgi:hypothetical protein
MPTKANIQIVNCSNFSLVGKATAHYQMEQWDFGTTSNQNYNVYAVEFYSGSHDEDDSGKAEFSFNGENAFELIADSNSHSGHYIDALIQGNAPGIVIAMIANGFLINTLDPSAVNWYALDGGTGQYQLGFINSNTQQMGIGLVDLNILFDDPTEVQSYYAAIQGNNLTYAQELTLMLEVQRIYAPLITDLDSWMGQMLSVIGNAPLEKICLPGTHDSGMDQVSHAIYGRAANTQTQTLSIGEQLMQGIRYIDCRPVIWENNGSSSGCYLGHFSYITVLGWVGATGQNWQDVMDQIKQFLQAPAHRNEVILLDFSNAFNVNDNGTGYGLNETDTRFWLKTLTDTLGSYLYKGKPANPPNGKTLNEILQSGAQIIARFDNNFTASLIDPQNGYWSDDLMTISGGYSDTNDLDYMVTDQVKKLKQSHTDDYPGMFLTSWTLTQDSGQAFAGIPSIATLAASANALSFVTFEELFLGNDITTTTYPNIIITDYANEPDTRILEVAIRVNHLVNASAAVTTPA